MKVFNKFTGELLEDISQTDVEAAGKIILNGSSALEPLRKTSDSELREIFIQASRRLKDRAGELADLITAETGKPVRHSRDEVAAASGLLMRFSTLAEAGAIDSGTACRGSEFARLSMRSPYGLTYSITPSSNPLSTAASEAAIALSGRNPIILKPSSLTPLSTIRLFEILHDAGLPDYSAQVMAAPGDSEPAAFPLQDDRVQVFRFSGKMETARRLNCHAGLRRVDIHTGSYSPAIVWGDADLDTTAIEIANSVFGNHGNMPFRAQRVFVGRESEEYLLNRLAELGAGLKFGDPADESTDLGPFTEKTDAEILQRELEMLVNGGTRVVSGGKAENGVYAPTVLETYGSEASSGSFTLPGPVVLVTPIDSFDEAVKLANSTSRFGQAGIFTSDMNLALAAVENLEHEISVINGAPPYTLEYNVNSSFSLISLEPGTGVLSRNRIALIKR